MFNVSVISLAVLLITENQFLLLVPAEILMLFIYNNLDGTVKMLKLAGTVEQGDEDKLNQTLSRIINKKNVPNFAELKVKPDLLYL